MISINNLTKIFGENAAVNDISLDIPRGQILGILGPNGAGKTTTLRMITGYITPSSGSVMVNGIDASTNFIDVKGHIGYLPESSPIYPDMLVYDYLKFIANIRDISSSDTLKRLQELADLCGIREVMHKPVSTLSRGYKQRVGLALALMGDPDILILDEPTSGLDPNQIVEIRSIIKEIGKKKTIIFSTHILSEAEATCDRVVIINKGKLVADGTSEILKKSKSGEKITLITVKYTDPVLLKKTFEKLKGISKIEIEEAVDTLTIKLSTANDMRAEIYNLIKKQDWILLEMIQESESLEHIFKELTQASR
ncbi:MAG: ATP-binding cassette domain-containing protein, partial [Spirochaetota bacterium]|nr:ATP-binding cassette domain-containing protein [Spirochaetota bacterium]